VEETAERTHTHTHGLGQLSQYSVLTTEFTTGVRSPAEAKDFSSSLCVQISSEAHQSPGTGGPFPACKARLGRDADHSPPSNAEVRNE
jgi:hypothetical protein